MPDLPELDNLISFDDFMSDYAQKLKTLLEHKNVKPAELVRGLKKNGVMLAASNFTHWFKGRFKGLKKGDTNYAGPPNIYDLHVMARLLGVRIEGDLIREIAPPADHNEFEVTGADTVWIVRNRILQKSKKTKSALDLIKYFIQEDATQAAFSTGNTDEIRLLSALHSSSIELLSAKRADELEVQLTSKFSLNPGRCIVGAYATVRETLPAYLQRSELAIRTEVVAKLAAAAPEVWEPLITSKGVAMTGGKTISRLVDLLRPHSENLVRTEWYSMLAVTDNLRSSNGTSANALVSRIASRQTISSANLMPYCKDDSVHEYIETIPESAIMFVTVGAVETAFDKAHYGKAPAAAVMFNQLPEAERNKAVGDILLRMLDAEGNELHGDEFNAISDQHVNSFGLDKLRKVSRTGIVWLIAEDVSKAKVIKASLNASLVNGLILDRRLAEALLNL